MSSSISAVSSQPSPAWLPREMMPLTLCDKCRMRDTGMKMLPSRALRMEARSISTRMMNSQLPSAGRMRPPSRFQRYMGSMKQ